MEYESQRNGYSTVQTQPTSSTPVTRRDRTSSVSSHASVVNEVRASGQEDDWYSSTSNLPVLFKYPAKMTAKFGEAQKWITASRNHGYVRVYLAANPKNSHIIPCTTQTSTEQICFHLGLLEDLYVQFCGDKFQRLEPTDQPLQIQHDFLYAIGYTDIRRIQKMGTSSELGYLIRFLSGLPLYDNSFAYKTKHSVLKVKSNKGLKMWKEKLCIIRGTRLLIFKNLERPSNPSIVYLAKGEVQVDKSRHFCLKIISHLQDGKSYSFEMKDEVQFEKWFRYFKSSTSELPNSADLSHSNLEFIPKPLLEHHELNTLNLRHNIMRVSNTDQMAEPTSSSPVIQGALEDLTRFHNLQNLNLSDNNLEHFPECLCQLINLKDLNLSSNRIIDVPNEVGALVKLECLRLENNLLWSLPDDISDLSELFLLDLSFNQFTFIPEVICSLGGSATPSIYLTGNQITHIQDTLPAMRTIKKIYLRLNSLTLPQVETKLFGSFECLTHLDIRNNSVTYLNILSLKTIEYLDCSYNKITEICINGTSLKFLAASRNIMNRLLIEPKPNNLEEIDISRNVLTEIPNYLSFCYFLRKIVASHNKLNHLPKNLFTERSSKLKILIAHHNEITQLPREIEHVPLEELDLHCNRLVELHNNFLYLSARLRLLNLSQNCIEQLPPMEYGEDRHRIQELYLSFNKLNNECLAVISCYKRLQILHLAFNYITEIYPEFIGILYTLKELNISGNEIQELPEQLLRLPFLTILRAHCNKLVTLPENIQESKLKILDLGSNYILGPSLMHIMDSKLDLLDISGNAGPGVSINDFNTVKGKRRVRLIDMSGDDRLVAGVVPHGLKRNQGQLNLLSGMAETAGNRNKLCISVVKRVHCPTPDSALFAVFDGGYNNLIPLYLQHNFLQAYMEELKRCRENSDTLKYTLLTLHKSLRTAGQRLGASVSVVTLKQSAITTWQQKDHSLPVTSSWKWKIHVANMGDIRVVACRSGRVEVLSPSCCIEDNLNEQIRVRNSGGVITSDYKINGITHCSRLIGASYLYPSVLPDPLISDSVTCQEGDSLIIASRGLWDHVSPEEAFGEIQGMENPVAASKRLMDLAQAFGSKENLTVLVILFNSQPQTLDSEMTFPDVGIHDKEIYEASSATSEDALKSERLIHSSNFSRLPLDEFDTSENSMSSIQSSDSMKKDQQLSMRMDSSMGQNSNQHRYRKRNEALRMMEQQMNQRLTNEVKEKEFSSIFSNEDSFGENEGIIEHEKENFARPMNVDKTWFSSVKAGQQTYPETYQGQKFGLFKGGVTSRTLLNDKTFIMTAPGYAGSNFDSEDDLLSNFDRIGDASINPPSESNNSDYGDDDEFLKAALSHETKKKTNLFKRRGKGDNEVYTVHDYVRSETPQPSKLISPAASLVHPNSYEYNSALSSRTSSTSTLTKEKVDRESIQIRPNSEITRGEMGNSLPVGLPYYRDQNYRGKAGFSYAASPDEATHVSTKELQTRFRQGTTSNSLQNGGAYCRPIDKPMPTTSQLSVGKFSNKPSSSNDSDYETLDNFSPIRAPNNTRKIPISIPPSKSSDHDDDVNSYNDHIYATVGPKLRTFSGYVQPEDMITHL